MLAPSEQPLRTEDAPAARPRARGAPTARLAALLTGALGFFCFLPYAAVVVGNTTAVQVGSMLTLLLTLPVLFFSLRRGPLWLYALIVAPLCIAALKVAFTGDGDLSLCLKTVPVWALSCLTIVAAQVCAPRYAGALLTGIAAATLLHAAVGVWQYFSFANGQFPLAWLYVNPAFLSVQDNIDTLAKYTQRPFGLFPEPSAMSSSLAPWVLFWVAELCGIVRLRQRPQTWQRVLFAAAAAGGLGLIILSRSGHAAVTMAAAVLFVGIWFARSRATGPSYLAIVVVFGIVLPTALYFAAESLSDRMGGKSDHLGNSSWQDRTDSLRIGFWLVADGDLPTALFGLGPGLTSPQLQRTARLEAVWSVLLTYVYETGMVGLLVVCWIGAQLGRLWKSIRFDPAFAAIFFTWLVGATVTTSYSELLSIWLTLGWLTVWPALCQSKPAPAANAAWKPLARNAIGGFESWSAKPRVVPHWIPRRWTDSLLPARLGDAAAARPGNGKSPARRRPRRWSER